MENKQVEDFYDDFVKHQKKIGINLRHRQIFRFLKKNGLMRSHSVLEIGCGIGTVTSLVAGYLNNNASILGVDISPKSIELAKETVGQKPNVSFLVSDMSDFDTNEPFDVVFLPDVLEHIPIEDHSSLMKTIKKILKPTGFVLIHIPNPRFLEYMHRETPEKLQVIDQPLHTNLIIENIYSAGFFVEKLNTYSLFHKQPDYQIIILRPNTAITSAQLKNKYFLFLKNLLYRF